MLKGCNRFTARPSTVRTRRRASQLETDDHPPRSDGDRYNALPREVRGACKGCGNMLGPERGILVEYAFRRFPGREIVEDYRNGNACTAQAHSAMHDLRIGGER